MTCVHRILRRGVALAALVAALAASAHADDVACRRAMQLQAQGLSPEQIASALGATMDSLQQLCAAPRSVPAPAGHVAVGAAGPAPMGAAGPAPMGAAGPAPMGAAGPAPLGAAGPAPMGAATGGGSASMPKQR